MLVWFGLALVGVGVVRFAVAWGRRLTTEKPASASSTTCANRFSGPPARPAVRLLRPLAHRPAHVARHERHLERAHVPRLRLVFLRRQLVMIVAVTIILLATTGTSPCSRSPSSPCCSPSPGASAAACSRSFKDVQQRIADVTAAAERERRRLAHLCAIFAREDDELEKFSVRKHARVRSQRRRPPGRARFTFR